MNSESENLGSSDTPHPDSITLFKDAFLGYDAPGELYRSVYKGTSCGPTVGLRISRDTSHGPSPLKPFVDEADGRARGVVYGDDLRKLGAWETMRSVGGWRIEAIMVSSIVEGVEQMTETHEIPITADLTPQELYGQFWDAVQAVDREADQIWNETHGCETCHEMQGGTADDYEPGETWVVEDCPGCDGLGVPI